jgi:UDP-glucose 4-epimerase
VNYVFHYAAVVGVARTLKNPILVLKDIDGIRNILDLSKNTGVERVFFSSSSEVYGEPVEFPQNEETTPLNSRLPYAIVKNVGEAFLRSYQREYGLPFTVFRFFNTYGPRQSKDFVISRFIAQAVAGEDLTVYGDGSQSRTFCFIDDNVDTVIKCLRDGHAVNDVINVGSEEEMTVRQLAELMVRITGSKSKIKNLPALTEGDMKRRKPDISRMKQILGRPLISLEDGIRRTIEKRMF